MTRLLALLILLFPAFALAAELKVATWNLDWLTTREAGDRFLPPDVTPRSAEDFDRLARYAHDLNADLVAIEEVDGWSAASRLFPRDQYSIHMTRDRVTQRVGIAVRRSLRYDSNPDVTGLGLGHLRSGADITLHLGASDLRVLAVHLMNAGFDVLINEGRIYKHRRPGLPGTAGSGAIAGGVDHSPAAGWCPVPDPGGLQPVHGWQGHGTGSVAAGGPAGARD